MNKTLKIGIGLAALACSALATGVRADVIVLDEDFEGISAGVRFPTATIGEFFVQGGSVDVLNTGFFPQLCTAAGGSPVCIDLDGNSGGTLSSTQFFGPGTYNLTFDLAGSQRGDVNTTRLFIGDQANVPFTLQSGDQFQTFTVNNIVIAPGASSRLTFFNEGADTFGNLLDNVQLVLVTPGNGVPEPSSLLLLAAGAAGAGASLRRRTKKRF